mgnify:CR=1 FL=1
MLGILVLLSKNDLIEDVMSSIDLWAIDSADEETETKILKELKFINVYVFFNTGRSRLGYYHDFSKSPRGRTLLPGFFISKVASAA